MTVTTTVRPAYDSPARELLQQPGDAGGRGRLDEDAVVAGELALRGEDLVVGDRARTGRRTRRAAATASFHEAGLPIRIAVATVSGSGTARR